MRLLLDTHALLWFLREPDKLPPKTLGIIEQSGTEARVSIASLWEIAIKTSLKKLSLPSSYEELFPASVTASGLSLLPIEPAHLHALCFIIAIHSTVIDRAGSCRSPDHRHGGHSLRTVRSSHPLVVTNAGTIRD
jgi:PIN domain nuclease of toxin-antitoxin system